MRNVRYAAVLPITVCTLSNYDLINAIGAILAFSCCIVPQIPVTLGVSGAGLSNLSVLDSYLLLLNWSPRGVRSYERLH